MIDGESASKSYHTKSRDKCVLRNNNRLIYIADAANKRLSKFVNAVYSLAIAAITAKQVTQ